MLRARNASRSKRKSSGRLDIIIIAVIALLLVVGLIFVILQIIGHSEEHVETVRKTKAKYTESLRWRPDSELCETRIHEDLLRHPERTRAEYTDLNLNESCLQDIGNMSRLEELKLTRSTFQDQWLEYLSKLRLRSLGLHGSSITDKAVPYILKMQSLDQLSIGDTDLTNKGLELLSAHPRLKALDIELGRCITNDGIKYIGKMKQLERLEVPSSSTLTGKCLANLANLKNLTTLGLESIPVDAEDLHFLAGLKKLRSLDLSNSALNDQCLIEITKLPSIKTLNLTGSDFSNAGLLSLAKMKKLSSLIIKDCPKVDYKTIEKFRSMRPDCRVQHSSSSAIADQMSQDKVKQEVEFLKNEVNVELEKQKELP
jgi:hypothetical protein